MVANENPVVFFDIDGTWMRWQLFDAWIQQAIDSGILSRIVRQLAEPERLAYQNRKGSFHAFMAAQVKAYQADGRLVGVSVADAQFVARQALAAKGRQVHIFTQCLSEAAQATNNPRAIISGSMSTIVKEFALLQEIEMCIGTELPIHEGLFAAGEAVEWASDKGRAVDKLVADYQLKLAGSVAIGDTTTDIPMFERVTYPICFNPVASLLRVAREQRWPVVWEKKDTVSIFRPNFSGRLTEVDLFDILPESLSLVMKPLLDERLKWNS